MEEKYKSFIEFDFDNHPQWQEFITKVTPKPRGHVLLEVKKEFYLKYVDSDFQANYSPNVVTDSNQMFHDFNNFAKYYNENINDNDQNSDITLKISSNQMNEYSNIKDNTNNKIADDKHGLFFKSHSNTNPKMQKNKVKAISDSPIQRKVSTSNKEVSDNKNKSESVIFKGYKNVDSSLQIGNYNTNKISENSPNDNYDEHTKTKNNIEFIDNSDVSNSFINDNFANLNLNNHFNQNINNNYLKSNESQINVNNLSSKNSGMNINRQSTLPVGNHSLTPNRTSNVSYNTINNQNVNFSNSSMAISSNNNFSNNFTNHSNQLNVEQQNQNLSSIQQSYSNKNTFNLYSNINPNINMMNAYNTASTRPPLYLSNNTLNSNLNNNLSAHNINYLNSLNNINNNSTSNNNKAFSNNYSNDMLPFNSTISNIPYVNSSSNNNNYLINNNPNNSNANSNVNSNTNVNNNPYYFYSGKVTSMDSNKNNSSNINSTNNSSTVNTSNKTESNSLYKSNNKVKPNTSTFNQTKSNSTYNPIGSIGYGNNKAMINYNTSSFNTAMPNTNNTNNVNSSSYITTSKGVVIPITNTSNLSNNTLQLSQSGSLNQQNNSNNTLSAASNISSLGLMGANNRRLNSSSVKNKDNKNSKFSHSNISSNNSNNILPGSSASNYLSERIVNKYTNTSLQTTSNNSNNINDFKSSMKKRLGVDSKKLQLEGHISENWKSSDESSEESDKIKTNSEEKKRISKESKTTEKSKKYIKAESLGAYENENSDSESEYIIETINKYNISCKDKLGKDDSEKDSSYSSEGEGTDMIRKLIEKKNQQLLDSDDSFNKKTVKQEEPKNIQTDINNNVSNVNNVNNVNNDMLSSNDPFTLSSSKPNYNKDNPQYLINHLDSITNKNTDEFYSYIISKEGCKTTSSLIIQLAADPLRTVPIKNILEKTAIKLTSMMHKVLLNKYSSELLQILLTKLSKKQLSIITKNKYFLDNFTHLCTGKFSNKIIQMLIEKITNSSSKQKAIMKLVIQNIDILVLNQYANFVLNGVINNFYYHNIENMLSYIENNVFNLTTKSAFGHYLVKTYFSYIKELLMFTSENERNNNNNVHQQPDLGKYCFNFSKLEKMNLSTIRENTIKRRNKFYKIVFQNVKLFITHKYAHFVIIDIIEILGHEYCKDILNFYLENIESYSKIIYGYAIAKRLYINLSEDATFLRRFAYIILQNFYDFDTCVNFNLTKNIIKASIACCSSKEITLFIDRIQDKSKNNNLNYNYLNNSNISLRGNNTNNNSFYNNNNYQGYYSNNLINNNFIYNNNNNNINNNNIYHYNNLNTGNVINNNINNNNNNYGMNTNNYYNNNINAFNNNKNTSNYSNLNNNQLQNNICTSNISNVSNYSNYGNKNNLLPSSQYPSPQESKTLLRVSDKTREILLRFIKILRIKDTSRKERVIEIFKVDYEPGFGNS